ncbi:hypothetical protein MAPG_10866 [Magnaporthiopsis poae ATCC 64411]|uniref:Uncharacterized protein n=1 Tax=Magnaporthiopsis poae (strain ATCC 64411 / 73-15) TaxID=644358 RepID=A0A0C4EDQ8_MAGP6|nr:hypothetical protein MAPG_10866 [Magnaporthiopsis poae ATCC 64411]
MLSRTPSSEAMKTASSSDQPNPHRYRHRLSLPHGRHYERRGWGVLSGLQRNPASNPIRVLVSNDLALSTRIAGSWPIVTYQDDGKLITPPFRAACGRLLGISGPNVVGI